MWRSTSAARLFRPRAACLAAAAAGRRQACPPALPPAAQAPLRLFFRLTLLEGGARSWRHTADFATLRFPDLPVPLTMPPPLQQGLSSAAAQKRISEEGKNELTPPAETAW